MRSLALCFALAFATTALAEPPLKDYDAANHLAVAKKLPLVFFFEDAEHPAPTLPAETINTVVVCVLPTDYEMWIDGKKSPLIQHPSFRGLSGKAGAARGEFRDGALRIVNTVTPSNYGTPEFERQILHRGLPPVERLMNAKDEKKARAYLPNSQSDWFETLKKRSDLVFYTKTEIPAAYQHNAGVHSPLYNISAVQPRETRGNAALEFPWEVTAGISPVLAQFKRSYANPPFKAVHFMALPESGDPIVYWREVKYEGGFDGTVWRWQFPVGTIFGEVLLQQYSGEEYLTFEVRTRRKARAGTKQDWVSTTFRPFWNPRELAQAIRAEQPDFNSQSGLAAAVEKLESAYAGETETLNDNSVNAQLTDLRHLPHQALVFQHQGLRYTLPELPASLVRTLLLKTPFRAEIDAKWSEKDGLTAYAPTSNQAGFGLVPQGYFGGHIETSSRSCMTCHNQTLTYSRDFDYYRDWYGFTPGDDGIFSWHPFADISYNGSTQAVTVRASLAASGRWVVGK